MAKMTAKKALLTSILSLLVCVTMLVGTTFAWFTDSVTSGTNRIVAGNLDVEVYHTSASVSEPASVQNRTDLFTDENGDAMLWEPGAVTYENITVKNVGTLSLKYKLNMNVTDYNAVDGTDKTLLDVLKVKILEGDDIIDVIDRASVLALDWTANVQTLGEFEDADVLYAANDVPANEISEKTFQVIVYWLPLSNDNDYNLSNGKTSTDGEPLFVEFGINLVATQYTYEEDSFDDQYDAGTTLPALPVTINKTFKSEAVVNNATANVHIVNASNVKVAELEQSSAQAIINSVNNIIENLENVADQKKPDTDVSTVFTLSIETTETKEDSVTYEIDLNAITTYTTNSDVTATHELSASEVNNALAVANKIVVASVNIGQDLKEVTVKHSGIPMAQLANADVEEEGYYYNAATGDLTIKTKSFSPFSIEYKTEFVARIGEVGYKTLAAAFEAAETNDTVVLLQNVRTVDGYKIDKTIALDTNGKTITVETGASYNNRAFKVTSGTFTVYGGGTVDALSENGNGCYGAFRAEIGTELVLSNITLKNYRTNGLNVKLLGATATLNNVKIDSVYGGGIEVTESNLGNNSQKGFATLTDCTFTQATYGDWCSTTLSVSGGSRLVVNSGSYTSENYALYVFSSGGEIEVKGGTFNGNATFGNKTGVAIVAEIDTGTFPGYTGGFRIVGGTFNGDYAITSPAYMSITGGTFDHDPTAYVADGYMVAVDDEDNPTLWTVLSAIDAAKKYALDAGGEIVTEYSNCVTARMSDGVIYVFYPDGIVTVFNLSGYNGKNGTGVDDSTYYIFGGLVAVNGINQAAFSTTSTITKVKFTGNLSDGGKKGFEGNASVTDVDFGGMTVIPNRLFYKANGLVSVTIPNTIVSISESAFQECANLETIVIPDTITTIPKGFANGCVKLTSINIPSSVTTIGQDALRATAIASVTIPASVKTIGSQAFRDCENLTEINILIESTDGLSIATNAFSNVAGPYPTCTMTFVNSEVYNYFKNLGLNSAQHITFVEPEEII